MSATTSGDPAFAGTVTQRISRFLLEIGLEIQAAAIDEETFMPGVLIRVGVMIVDEAKLKYPGDLLHEAGHLAIVTPERRGRMGTDAGIKAHEEMAAIAWSWAALRHLGLAPTVVFHPDGYKGESQSLVDALGEGRGPGIPCLAWFGMCSDPYAGPDAASELPPFPTMTRWLRESDAVA